MKSTGPRKNRPIILAFTRYYLPGFRAGGPVRSIANLVERLGDEFDFHIVTTDRDKGDSHRYAVATPGEWVEVGKARVRYLDVARLSLRTIQRLVNETPHDLIYLNSFFDPRFTLRVLLSRLFRRIPVTPTVIAPRGEFSPGALAIRSTKKMVYLSAAKTFRLCRSLTWQASSEMEALDILGNLGSLAKGRIRVAMDLAPSVETKAGAPVERPVRTPFRVCFLSRISPMKNLDFALRVLAKIEIPVAFSIYGPIDSQAYWRECQTLLSDLPEWVKVTYHGEVPPSAVVDRLAEQDLFFLPTRGENFGHVIHEALRAGLPVLISDQTPWQDLEEKRVGWAFPLAELEPYVRAIREVASWSGTARGECANRAQLYAQSFDLDKDSLSSNRRLFLEAIETSQNSWK
jgi:glycosyltransferase involved in cell wall biosynthesis